MWCELYHFCAQFQTISDLRWAMASAIIPREWLLGKEAIWVEALRCWESRPKEMSLSRRENSHHQAQNRCRVPGNRLMMVFRNKSLSWTSNYLTTHTNKHHRLLGIISRILSDNNNIGVSILDPLSHSACCFQCLCCTIPDQSRSHWTGCPCVCLPLWLGCVQSPHNFSDCTMHYYHRASH